jgi:hypothetical protein
MPDCSPQHDLSVRPRLPLSLKIVAWLFIVWGSLAAIEVVLSLVRGKLFLNFNVVGIFVGRGLLELRPGWRTCALVILWIFAIPFVALAVRAGLGFGVVPVKWLYTESLPAMIQSRELGVAICLLPIGFIYWQYRVLTRPDVRHLFLLSQAQERRNDLAREADEDVADLIAEEPIRTDCPACGAAISPTDVHCPDCHIALR